MTVNGSPLYVSASDIDAVVSSQTMTFNTTAGNSSSGQYQLGPITGITLSRLVTLVGLSPDIVTSAVVSDGSDPAQTISHDEIATGFQGDPNWCPNCQAIIDISYNGGTNAVFRRPLRTPTDLNARDILTSTVGNVLTVAFTTTGGQQLGMSATASDTTPNAGDAVQFSVVPDAAFPAGTHLSWAFDDGSAPIKDTPTPSHTFAANGTYSVTVTAVAPDGSHGVAALTIQVGSQTGSGIASTPAAPNKNAAGKGKGGNGSGGGKARTGSGKGKSSGAATGPNKSHAKSGNGSSTNGSAGAGTAVPRRADVTPAPKTQASDGSATPAPVATPAGATPMPTPAPGAQKTTPGAAQATTPRPDRRQPLPPDAGQLIRVSGLAVDGRGPNIAAALAAADAIAAAAPPRSPSRAAAGHGGATIAGGVTGGLVIIGLLGLGAAREWRRLPKVLPT